MRQINPRRKQAQAVSCILFLRLGLGTSGDVNRQRFYVSFYLLVVSLNDTTKVLFLRTNFKIHIKISPGVGNYLLC